MIYALLIHMNHDPPRDTPRYARGLEHHRALQAEVKGRGELLAVSRLADLPTSRSVSRQGDGFMVTDGPFAETKEWLAGLYLVECADEATAIARARQICTEEVSRIEVRPVTWAGP